MFEGLVAPYVIIGFIFGTFCASIANEKGYSQNIWLIIGFFFSFVALIAIAGMPDLKSQKYLRRLVEALPQNEHPGA